MNPQLDWEHASQNADDLRRAGRAARRRFARRETRVPVETEVAIRAARPDDRPAIAALAALDGLLPPLGGSLVAEVEGSIRAVLPLDGTRSFADPFRHTADLVALLEARAAQFGEEPPRQPGLFARLVPAVRRRVA